MEKLLVSACLLGVRCKYSGGSNELPEDKLRRLREKYEIIPVCPETAGGLPTPRDPSERQGSRVMMKTGRDVTAEYSKGAETAAALAQKYGCRKALLKEKSPACGSGKIYDGSFTGTLTEGWGVAAERLKTMGLELTGEKSLDTLLK